ncbi:hypothetical protein LEP1GSC165_1831 [Leptospira santarosai str. CBC523]|nr:hypothetical protein LEP1GSC165_1831 [Leptospira santarosai str. CBC523]
MWKENLILVSSCHSYWNGEKRNSRSSGSLISKKKNPVRPNIPWDIIKLIRRVAKETISGERQNSTVSYKNLVTVLPKEPFLNTFLNVLRILKNG